jgi:hypothetical protein
VAERAVIVCGPESSGTRLATRLCLSMGCRGDDGHTQPWDTTTPEPAGGPVVWRRSLPHAKSWPDLADMAARLRGAGFEVRGVVTVRCWRCTVKSQEQRGHARGAVAEENVRRAVQHASSQLNAAKVPWALLVYEALVARPGPVVRWLAGWLGLPAPAEVDVRDEDRKHW